MKLKFSREIQETRKKILKGNENSCQKKEQCGNFKPGSPLNVSGVLVSRILIVATGDAYALTRVLVAAFCAIIMTNCDEVKKKHVQKKRGTGIFLSMWTMKDWGERYISSLSEPMQKCTRMLSHIRTCNLLESNFSFFKFSFFAWCE